jgi:rhodanese-related sulfurtransferase
MKEITPVELKARLDAGEALVVLDVREDNEVQVSHIPGSRHLPLGNLGVELQNLTDLKDAMVVCVCRSGGRSATATAFLTQNGFTNVHNMVGGMRAWQSTVDPSIAVA